MVQESGPTSNLKAFSAVNRNETGQLHGHGSRKVSHDSGKQFDNTAKNAGKQASDAQKYGAWGSVYKNKDHFVNMHLC